jgi:hypothetical protein
MLTNLVATEVASMTPVISVPHDYVSRSSTGAYDERTSVFVVTIMSVVVSVITTLGPHTQASKCSKYEDSAKKHGDHASVSNKSNHLITPFKKSSNCSRISFAHRHFRNGAHCAGASSSLAQRR